MEYDFRRIEKEWQQKWQESGAYKVSNDSAKPKYYVLDMFPYPSGAGLHVGHPLGYIASDIYARYKRLKGFNVLHPMGYDAFGLPAEQYAIEHGIHPAVSTEANISNFRSQLDKIGFCYDWSREVNTSKPEYYKWTQWLFLQLFNSYFDQQEKKAKPISELMKTFEREGSVNCQLPTVSLFTAEEWNSYDEKQQADILMDCRLAFSAYGEVNWCEALGTVLANDEVVNGVSERGGHPVEKRKMRQWYLRITAYADRLLEGLNTVDFSDSMKEMQTNWIGKSSGAEISFELRVMSDESGSQLATHHSKLVVYTTRPDTIFGVDFMVVAPEHELVPAMTSSEQATAVEEYIAYVKSRSERERMAEKKISGVFTGAYAINPFDGREIPVWISEYVLAGYGTGAIMAVPCGDERDHKFAKHFNIPITNIIGSHYNGEEANPTKEAILENSGFLNGMLMKDAIEVAIKAIEEKGIGTRKVNYKMRDAGFSRQRYWGEPFPIQWVNGVPYPLDESELPLTLPEVDKYSPGPYGEGPLANIPEWVHQPVKLAKGAGSAQVPSSGGDLGEAARLETSTMPGYAGSSWYFLRYMDPENDKEFCSRSASDYWGQVDLYIGGTEHAVGHLLYSRMWTKVLYDLGLIGHDEPFKRLLNQGMIQGKSAIIYRLNFISDAEINNAPQIYVSKNIAYMLMRPDHAEHKFHKIYQTQLRNIQKRIQRKNKIDAYSGSIPGLGTIDAVQPIRIFHELTYNGIVEIEDLRDWQNRFDSAEYILDEDFNFHCDYEVEKMSKSKHNVTNPDNIINKYGADTFRMYEMFLGPVEMSKPWDTQGIDGVHRFLKKFWRLFADEVKGWIVTDDEPTAAELKVLHNTIRKIESDTERFSFNTAVSAFMIATNELADLKCHKRKILEPMLILMAPYAPHITAELYDLLGSSQVPSPGGDLGEAAAPRRNLWKAGSKVPSPGGDLGEAEEVSYPEFNEKYVTETTKEYPISVNGKLRTTLNISLDAAQPEVEQLVLANEVVQKWLEGKDPKKIIFVKGKMVNVVV